jgi:hypothetical protein
MGRKSKKNKLPPFVPITWDMLNSRAYRDLSPSAGKALPLFLGKVKVPHNSPQRYHTSFHFPYGEAKRFGFAKRTFWRVIMDLMNKGFLDPVGKGGLKSLGKGYNTFKLSPRWTRYGEPNFEVVDWRTFHQDK